MIRKKILRVIAILIVFSLICGSSELRGFADYISEGTSGYVYGDKITETTTFESETLRLDIKENGRLSLYDKSSDYMWVSNPCDVTPDVVAFGVNKQRVESQILISYLGSSIVMNTKSFAQSVLEDGSFVETFRSGNRAICVYHFEGLGFEIPVEYTLENRKLIVTVYSDKIKETSSNRLVEFSVNPFFGAGTQDEKGFILIPDGSGATIGFNNGKTSDNRLTLDVMYGNRSHVSETRPPLSQPVLIPCYGISKQLENKNATMLAYITDGAVGGQIITNVAGRETGCNYVYYNYIYRESVTKTMLDRTYAAKTKLVASNLPVSNEKYQTCYIFGDPEKSGIAAMADACRVEIFSNINNEKITELPIYLDMLMGVRIKRNFLGIPYRTLKPLTTLEEVDDIVKDLTKSNVKQFRIRLRGISDNGIMQGKIENKIQISRKIGTVAQLNELNRAANITAYPAVNPIEFNKSGNGLSVFTDGSLDLLLDTVNIPKYLTAAGSENTELPKDSLLIPQKMEKAVQKLCRDLNSKSIRAISPSVLAEGTYCNYSKKNTSDIAKTLNTLCKELDDLKKQANILLEAPAVYAWNSADEILFLPGESSRYNICDRSVPFLQMLLSGIIPYSSESLNFAGDCTDAMLQCIRTGSAPAFTVMASEYDCVRNTDAKDYYAAGYNDCRQTIIECYTEIEKALGKTYGLRITDFIEHQEGFSVTEFSDGTEIWVNSNDQPIIWNGRTIEANSYAVIEKGKEE